MRTDPAELRRQVAALGRRGRGGRFPEELRAALIVYARQQRGRGDVLRKIARSTGVSAGTIQRWTVSDGETARSQALVPVVVREQGAVLAGALTLKAPGGYQVEGLSVVTAAELLLRLE